MQTIYNHKTGKTHTGEPVDCAEIMAMSPDWKAAPKPEEGKDPQPAPGASDGKDQAALDAALRKLPAQVKSGEYKDADYVVTSMRAHFGADLFSEEMETAVRALFPAPTGTGRPSAKIGK